MIVGGDAFESLLNYDGKFFMNCISTFIRLKRDLPGFVAIMSELLSMNQEAGPH